MIEDNLWSAYYPLHSAVTSRYLGSRLYGEVGACWRLCKPFRLYRYSKCSVECLVLALIYIDRFIQSSNIQVNSLTIHRILLTSVVLAAKTYDDNCYTNTHYARVGGIPVEELNCLEIEFLFNIGFSLYVSCEDYLRYHTEIYKHSISRVCNLCSRGDGERVMGRWFGYSYALHERRQRLQFCYAIWRWTRLLAYQCEL